MVLEHLIKSESVLCNAQARSKKHCLEILSEVLAQATPDIANEEIFSKLIERERLGCTSLESGVAFPHCRIDDLARPTGALLKLSDPVDFDAPDAQPVDLVFGMMVPAEFDAELNADIGQISTFLKNDDLRARLRSANSSRELYDALIAHPVKPGDSRV